MGRSFPPVDGDPPSLAGALACSLREVVEDVVGSREVLRALEAVPPDVRQQYLEVTAVGWISIDTMEEVFRAIAVQAGRTVADLHAEVARISIERTMRTLWRMLLRLTTDRALVSRTPAIFDRSYNRGRLEAVIPEPGRGVITLSDWPDVPEWPIRATQIGIETVLRVAGRRDVRVEAHRTPTGAQYLASWD